MQNKKIKIYLLKMIAAVSTLLFSSIQNLVKFHVMLV